MDKVYEKEGCSVIAYCALYLCNILLTKGNEDMYYKLRQDVLFRQYDEYGLITDNSEFGYRMLNDTRSLRGEKYVSKSGAVMLATLDRNPKSIDDIVDELAHIFVGVDAETLKNDTVEFLQYFVDEGFLTIGDDIESCRDYDAEKPDENENQDDKAIAISSDDCAKNVLKTNEFLRSIHIEIANACNERCAHCYIPHKYKTNVMDSELFYKIVEEGRKMNIIHVTLSGGEPLLHNDIIAFLRRCRELDLSVNVLSNLTLLSDAIIDEMKKNPLLSVQTSVYAMDSAVHDNITKLQGSLEKTICGLKKLMEAKIPVQISCPVMKQNKDDFVSVIRWGYDNNISVAVEPVIFASYDHSGDNLSNRLTIDEIGKVIDYELEEGYADIISNLAKEKELMKSDEPICSVCRYSFCISATGEVYPCAGWQTNVVGDIENQSLSEIWEHSDKIKCLRKIKRKDFIKCVDCKDRGYCTVCMMCNSNENQDGDAFRINEFNCKVAELKHEKLTAYMGKNYDTGK